MEEAWSKKVFTKEYLINKARSIEIYEYEK